MIGCFQTGCIARESTVPPCYLHRLRHCRAFVFSRLWRKNTKAPDLRVVGDSGGLMWALLLLANSFSNPIIMNLFQYFKIFRP
jgi:hypothetical protein